MRARLALVQLVQLRELQAVVLALEQVLEPLLPEQDPLALVLAHHPMKDQLAELAQTRSRTPPRLAVLELPLVQQQLLPVQKHYQLSNPCMQ